MSCNQYDDCLLTSVDWVRNMLSVIELSILLVATCSKWAGGLPRWEEITSRLLRWVQLCNLRFVPSAGDHIKVGYRSSVRMGAVIKARIWGSGATDCNYCDHAQDYTRLEISVATAGALEDSLSLARGGVTIELMSGPRETGRWELARGR